MTNKLPIGIFIKDTHLSKNTIEINKSIFKQAKEQAIKYGVDIFHGGDIFSSRNAQPLDTLNTFHEILEDLGKVNIHCIQGNHDLVDQESEVSYLTVYKNHPNFNLYSKESILVCDKVAIHFLPYFKESGSYLDRLKSIDTLSGRKNLLLTHIAVSGVRNNDYSEVENCLKKELFDKFDISMVGHYHDESWIGDKIWYFPGAYQANFGETNKKGCILMYDDLSYDFIKFEFPEYIKIKIDISDDKALKKFEKEHSNSNDNIRITLIGDEHQLASVNKEKYADIGIDVKFEKNISITELSALSSKESVFDRSNIPEAFSRFCEANKYESSKISDNYLNSIL